MMRDAVLGARLGAYGLVRRLEGLHRAATPRVAHAMTGRPLEVGRADLESLGLAEPMQPDEDLLNDVVTLLPQ